jgi:hypothetical protein
MTKDLLNVTGALDRLRGLTVERVVRSVRFRTMNKLARLDPVREASRLGLRHRRDVTSEVFGHAPIGKHVQELQREGISMGLDLPPEVRDGIRTWLADTPCYGNYCKEWGFLPSERADAERKAGKRFTVGAYYHLLDCPGVRQLVSDPVLEELALRYVGPRARFLHALAWWSYANEVGAADRNEFAQLYHFDLDDYRFVKFFFYLTDVDRDAGPHVYVRGTHKGKKLRHLYPMRRLSDDEVESTYGAANVLEVHGRAGTGFAVDTFGLHKGLPPRTRERLVIQLEFGQHNWIGQATEPPREELRLL